MTDTITLFRDDPNYLKAIDKLVEHYSNYFGDGKGWSREVNEISKIPGTTNCCSAAASMPSAVHRPKHASRLEQVKKKKQYDHGLPPGGRHYLGMHLAVNEESGATYSCRQYSYRCENCLAVWFGCDCGATYQPCLCAGENRYTYHHKYAQ